MNFNEVIPVVISTAVEAGKAILEIYEKDFSVNYKDDNSPLTAADLASNTIITDSLKKNFPEIPVVSEESKSVNFDERKNWPCFWLVDPLDGTKEFIKKKDDFTVNIALIENNRPILGIVYAPVFRKVYFGVKDNGSFLIEIYNKEVFTVESIEEAIKLPHTLNNDPESITIVTSRSHLSDDTKQYIKKLEEKYKNVISVSVGSSLKLCLVAEGVADCYPRFGPTMEWDTAAGEAVAEFAGCRITSYETSHPMVYNKENFLNPWFIVTR